MSKFRAFRLEKVAAVILAASGAAGCGNDDGNRSHGVDDEQRYAVPISFALGDAVSEVSPSGASLLAPTMTWEAELECTNTTTNSRFKVNFSNESTEGILPRPFRCSFFTIKRITFVDREYIDIAFLASNGLFSPRFVHKINVDDRLTADLPVAVNTDSSTLVKPKIAIALKISHERKGECAASALTTCKEAYTYTKVAENVSASVVLSGSDLPADFRIQAVDIEEQVTGKLKFKIRVHCANCTRVSEGGVDLTKTDEGVFERDVSIEGSAPFAYAYDIRLTNHQEGAGQTVVKQSGEWTFTPSI